MKRTLVILMCLLLTVPALAEEPINAPILEVKLKRWDERTLENAFLDGRDVEMENDGYEEHGTKVTAEADGYLSFRSMDVSMYDSFVLDYCDRGKATKGDIEGFSLDDAVSMLNDKLSPIGVETGEVFRYSAIKSADFEKLRREYAKGRRGEYSEYESIEAGLLREKATLDGFEGQTPPDDGYLIRIAKAYQGIACQLPLSWKRSFDSDNTYILAYVTAAGVQYLDTEEVFNVVRRKTPAGKKPISKEKAERVFKSALKGGQVSLDIARVAYEYAPIKKKKTTYLRPAWCFYARPDTAFSGYDWYIVGAVDAYTGECVLSED